MKNEDKVYLIIHLIGRSVQGGDYWDTQKYSLNNAKKYILTIDREYFFIML